RSSRESSRLARNRDPEIGTRTNPVAAPRPVHRIRRPATEFRASLEGQRALPERAHARASHNSNTLLSVGFPRPDMHDLARVVRGPGQYGLESKPFGQSTFEGGATELPERQCFLPASGLDPVEPGGAEFPGNHGGPHLYRRGRESGTRGGSFRET